MWSAVHPYPDPMTEAPLIVVGVDGWSRILNEHKKFAGMRFRESKELVDGLPAWIECTIHRWDRRVPTFVREYLCEVRGLSQAWITERCWTGATVEQALWTFCGENSSVKESWLFTL